MSFADAVRTCLEKFADFSGRARRSEYWYFALGSFLLSLVASILDRALPGQLLQILVALALLVPGLAVSWRRLHDTGRSGGWWFIGLVPIVGWIMLLIWMVADSQPGANEYGANPKEPQAIAA